MGLKQAWFGLIGKESPKPIKEKEPIDETTAQIRQMRAEYRRIQEKQKLLEAKAELRELQDEIYGAFDDDESSEDAKMMQILSPLIANLTAGKGTQTTLSPPSLNPIQPSGISITDEQIHTYLKSLPKNQIHMAKAMPKEILFRKVKENMPLTDSELENVYKILMTEY